MKYGLLTLVMLMAGAALVLTGCGGGASSGEPACGPIADAGRSSVTLAESPTLEQVRASLSAAGKTLPDFLEGGAVAVPTPVGEVGPQAYMTVLTLNRWLCGEYVAAKRTQWYECNLTSLRNLTDVYVVDRAGDPDLYVFSPLRPGTPNSSLWLIGYSAGEREEQVGSFITRDWGGPGRFVIAVFGYTAARYDLKIW